MDNLQAIGLPYDTSVSSCGSNKPNFFSWTNEESEIKVFVDYGMQFSLSRNSPKNCYGWTCESDVITNLSKHIKSNLDAYKNNFTKIFTYHEDLISLDNELFEYCYAGSNIPWTPVSDFGIHKKTKLVSFLCSNKDMTEGHKYRLSWAERLKNLVDMYGGACGSNIIGGSHVYHHQKKTEAMNDYMFSIVIENCKKDCYFTEKITDCFANGVIPVYYGTESISKHFNKEGIIFLTEDFKVESLSIDLYNSKIEYIKDNFDRVLKMDISDDCVYKKIFNRI